MGEQPKALHVNPNGENWDVESTSETLAQAESKQEAIEVAQEIAVHQGAEVICVHTSDGMVEKEIPVAKG